MRCETAHSTEIKNLKKEVHDSDVQHLALQKDVMILRDKLEKAKRDR